ncbi:ProQ/FINO family protein [Halomonas sp. SH5A2]|uniref:ProQ/FINO family protein n=1 Tax=Halomonas sp. SH5A2 TaxID=2749040 RepID=UPI001F0A8D81|nr:ProQ/FINO family protein [Halomonas sp. SH5A2]
MALLDDLERRLMLTQAELAQLRAENAKLKQQLAQAPRSEPPEAEASEAQQPSDEFVELNEKGKPELEPTTSPALDVSAQGEPKPEPPSPHALLAQWYKRYPQAFFKGHTQPLKVGIHHDLAEREPWSGKLIRRALANYVNLPRYIKSVREGATRIDLEGNEAGVVDAEAARHATEKRTHQASSSPNERSSAAREKKSHGKTAKPKKKAPAEASRKAEKTPLDADAPQKQLSLEDKLLGLQQKFKGR